MIRKPPETLTPANDNLAAVDCGLCLHWSYPQGEPCACAELLK
jgi:hypothetical protein